MRGAEVLVESVRGDSVSDDSLRRASISDEARGLHLQLVPQSHTHHTPAGAAQCKLSITEYGVICARVNSAPTPDSAGLRLRNLGFLMGSTVIRDTACAESLVDRSAAAV